MLGGRSWLFDLVALLYSLMIVFGAIYMARTVGWTKDGSSRIVLPAAVVIVAMAGALFAMPYHLQHIPFLSALDPTTVNPLGKMQPYKYFAIAALVSFGLLAWLYYVRSFVGSSSWSREEIHSLMDRVRPMLLIGLAICAMLTMLTMGWVRETARAYNGYLIYGAMSFEDERDHYRPGEARGDRAR
jgi:hypothetical protein